MKLRFKVRTLLTWLGSKQDASNSGSLTRFLRDEDGSFLVYMALILPILVGIAGLGTEGGLWLYKVRMLQSAADNAAYSAAVAYAADKTTDIAAQARAIVANDYNLVNGTNGVTVAVNRPPSGSCYTGTSNYTGSNAIEVIVTQPQTPLISSIWLSNNVTICGRAVAIVSGGGDCALALGTGGTVISTTANNVSVNFTGCSFFSNSSASNSILMNGNNDSMTAETIGTVGGVSVSGNLRTTISATSGDPPLSDPYASDATTWPSTCTSCTKTVCVPTGSPKTCTLMPGNYGSSGINLSVNNATYTMSPGVYYSSGNLVLGGNNMALNGTGVTIVLNGNSTIQSTGNNSSMTIAAPTANGWNQGIAIWEPTSNGNNTIGANSFTSTVTGVIYTPNATVNFNGNTGVTPVCTQIVAKSVGFGGNSINFTGACSSVPGVKIFGQIAALVE